MRVITQEEAIAAGLTAAVIVLALGALIGAGSYVTVQYPGLLPIWPAVVMGFAIGAMDRTRGDARRIWARVACGAGLLSVLAILLT